MSEIALLSGRPDRLGSRSPPGLCPLALGWRCPGRHGEGNARSARPRGAGVLGRVLLARPMPVGLFKRLRGAVNRVAGKPTVDIELPFERLGTEYGGYGILLDRLGSDSVVYSFGL